ncbi:hypothetical protein P692DRAFT_20643007, partial [Suillus brevipes Sb2]
DLYRSILPLCVEGSHLHQVVFDVNGIPYAVHLSREALAVCRADDDQLSVLPGVLSDTLGHRFNHHGDPSDLYERITRPLERNIVIFGDSGSGKSSVINAIAQTQLAKTSSSATGCTFAYQRYRVEISGQTFVLFDTAGLNEGTAGTVPAAKADENLKNLLNELMSPRSDGIGLLVYCVRSTRARRALIRNYNIFYSAICRKKVPIVVVVTGLENEPDMESWWTANGKEFKSRGMHFEDHACVTTLRKHSGISDVFTRRIEESSETLRNLVVNNCSD